MPAISDKDQVKRILAFTAGQARIIETQFSDFVLKQREALLPDVKRLYEESRFNQIPKLVTAPFAEVAGALRTVFTNAGNWEARELIKQWNVRLVSKIDVQPNIDLSFDPGDPAAAAFLQQNEMRFIREIEEELRREIALSLQASREAGLGAIAAANGFRDSLGLTEYQLNVVENYRKSLLSGSRDALQRLLRDRRFDSTVARAINTGSILDEAQINRMVQRYRDRMIAMRAETIARTEAAVAVNQARYLSLQQMASRVDMPFSRIQRTWRTVIDGRERHTHHAMNGQKRGVKEKFVSPSGAKLMFPGDRSSAPASEVIECRCVVLSWLLSEEQAAVAAAPRAGAPGLPRRGAIVTPSALSVPNAAPALTFDTGVVGSGLPWETGYSLVYADVEALEAGWLRGHPDYYLPRGYKGKTLRIREAAETKTPVPIPEVALDETGAVNFSDGRNRFVYLRDQAKQKYIPVAVPKNQATKFKRLYQYKETEGTVKPVKMTWDNWTDDSKLSAKENFLNWKKTFLGRKKRQELFTTSELMRSSVWGMHVDDLGLMVKEDLQRWSRYFTGDAAKVYKEYSETVVEMTRSAYLNKIVDADRLLVRAYALAEKLTQVSLGPPAKLATQQIKFLFNELKPASRFAVPVKPKVTPKPKAPPKKPKAPPKPKKPETPKVPKSIQAVEDDIKWYGQVKPGEESPAKVQLKYKSADYGYKLFAEPSFTGTNDLARTVINKAGSVNVEFSPGVNTAYFGNLKKINLSGMLDSNSYKGCQAIFRHEYGHYIDHVMQKAVLIEDYNTGSATMSGWSSSKMAKRVIAQHEFWTSSAVKNIRQFLSERDFYGFMKEKYGVTQKALGMLRDKNSLATRYLNAYIKKFETETGLLLDDLGLARVLLPSDLLQRAAVVRALETGNVEVFIKYISKCGGSQTGLGSVDGTRIMLHDFIGSVTRLEHGQGHSVQYYAKGRTLISRLPAVRPKYKTLGTAPTLNDAANRTILTNLHCTEAFADWFALYTQGPGERALLRVLAPDLNEAFEELLTEFSRQTGALNKHAKLS